MKFKSNTPVSAHDIESIEIAFESLDFTEMEQAQELLEDLTVLNQNIEKFGITEPVMHLVGGTLEAMDISIASKEACLEGLGDKIKEGAKKVWEMIIKVYERIRDYIKGLIGKFNKEKFNELKDKFKGQKVDTNEIDATNLIPSKYIKTIIDLANDAERNVDHDASCQFILTVARSLSEQRSSSTDLCETHRFR